MKSTRFKGVKAIALTVFSLLVIQSRLAAQDNHENRHKHHHYQFIDLGTFGGPESYIWPFYAFGSHTPINRRGVTVGAAGTAIPLTSNNNPFMCGGFDAIVPFVNHALELQNGVVTDLGSLAGPDNCSVATSINALGEVTGQSENGVIDPVTGVNELRAVLWKNGEILDLGTLDGDVSLAAGINNRGEVVGAALNAVADPFSIYDFQVFGSSNGTQTRAFVWQNGVMRDLGTLGGPDALGLFVNDRGQVAGSSYTSATPNPDNGPFCAGNVPTLHPFLWDNGKMTDLGSLGGTCLYQLGALNARGQVVGTSTLAGNLIFHPFLWTKPGPMRELRITLGGDCGTATAINDAGDVVGEADLRAPCGLPLYHAFLWKKGVMIDLGTVDGDTCSVASSINSKGQIVGVSEQGCANFVQHAVLWEDGGIVDLNTLIPPNSSLELAAAGEINDRGEIVGNGVPPGCPYIGSCGHAFLLIPCDDNHANIPGCDYSLVETSTTANDATTIPGAIMPATASPSLSPDATRQLRSQPHSESVGQKFERRKVGNAMFLLFGVRLY